MKIDPTALYKPLMAFSNSDGTFNPDHKLRGNHAAVRHHPELFIPADASDLEELAAQRERFPNVIIPPQR